jgi:hypothetical protein
MIIVGQVWVKIGVRVLSTRPWEWRVFIGGFRCWTLNYHIIMYDIKYNISIKNESM